MRKICSLLLIIALLLTSAYAETVFTVAGYDHGDTGHEWATNLFFERMQAVTGVQIDPVQFKTDAEWQTAKAAMFGDGGDMPDALLKANLTTQETQKLLAEGKIIDLKPYLAEHAPNLWGLLQSHPEWMEAVTLPTGEIAALPSIDELQFTNAMWINQAWLTKLKLQMPTTPEELTNVLIAFRDGDPNGNGKKDETPLTFSSLWDLRFLAHAFGVNANDYYLTTDENGTVSEILTTDNNRAFLTWLNSLYQQNLLDANGFTGLRDLSVANNDKDTPVYYGLMLTSTPVELVYPTHVKDYVLLDPMAYEGKQVYRDLTGDVICGTFAITSACQDVPSMLKWVDFLYSEAGFVLSEAGLEGEDYSLNDDGSWIWEIPTENLSSYLEECTIRSGISMPGYASVSFQQRIDDASTRHVVDNLWRLKQMDELPVPMVYLTGEQKARISELIYDLGGYAELQMVWFVTGDVELNDQTWADFCQRVKELGVDELISIFQTAVNEQQ